MHLRTYLQRFTREERAQKRRLLAQHAKVSLQTINNWETRRYRPTPEHFLILQIWSQGHITLEAMYDRPTNPTTPA